ICLMAVATLLLVIAASNLAGMLMTKGVGRRSEMSLRASLGAGPWRLVRQSLTESIVLAIAAGIAGLAGARIGIAVLLSEIPRQTGDPTLALPTVPIDAHVLLFALTVSLVTALTIGVGPALSAARVNLLSSLKAGEAVDPGTARSRLRPLVLGLQVALALVLLVVAGVLVRSLLRLELAPPGYDADHVVIADVQLPYRPIQSGAERVAAAAAAADAFARVLETGRASPDVTAAATTGDIGGLGLGLATSRTTIIARLGDRTTNGYRSATVGYVSADYFSAMGIGLLRGRAFDARDAAAPDQTVIVSMRLATELWSGQDPLGELVAFSSPASPFAPRWLTVVGVVQSVTLPTEEYPQPALYVPIESNPLLASALVVRGTGDASQLIAHITAAVARGDRTAIVASARTMDDSIEAMRFPGRLSASLLGSSGAASLVIAIIGVFGLVSYAVAQRTREIGVRMVLGATGADVVRLVLVDVARAMGLGLTIGLAAAFGALRYASHALVPLPNLDPLTFVTVPAMLAAAVLLACYVPARRAAGIDPNVALRHL
ncbi:MAG: FtsX-like permease family protein, partial [Vicinamibacterales bacterium]